MALTKVTGQVIKNTTDVTVGVLTVTNTLAVGGTVSIGGTLTYEDVTNVDAVGLITARDGIVVGSGITLSVDGDIFATGISTFADGVRIVGGSNSSNLKVITGNNTVGIFSGTTSGANLQLFDDDTEGMIRTVDGRLHIYADQGNAVADSELRFFVDGDLKGMISAGSSFSLANDSDTFLGHPAANTLTVTTAGSEAVRINSSGNVGLGTDIISGKLHLYARTGDCKLVIEADKFQDQGSEANNPYILFRQDGGTDMSAVGNNLFDSGSDHNSLYLSNSSSAGGIIFATGFSNGYTNSTERARFYKSGEFLVGIKTSRSMSGRESVIQVEGTDAPSSSIRIYRNATNQNAPTLDFGKSRGAGVLDNTLVQSGDTIGTISWFAADGTDSESRTAHIRSEVDGTAAANDMPGRIIFSTTSSGSAQPSERLRINSSGHLIFAGDTNTYIHRPASDTFAFVNGGTESLRITASSGKVYFGHTASIAVSSTSCKFQIVGTSNAACSMSISRFSDNVNSGFLFFGKSRGASAGSYTALQAGDVIGKIRWCGADGTDMAEGVAEISGEVDASVSSNVVPGRLVFKTSRAGTLTEVMRMADSGHIGVNNTAPDQELDIKAISSDATIRLTGAEAGDASIEMYCDEGDDNADKWRIISSISGNTLRFQNYASGAWVSTLILTGDATGSNLGQTKLLDGNATLPALTFIDDSNTGFYRIGSGAIGMSLNGVHKHRFEADGDTVFGGNGVEAVQSFSIQPNQDDGAARISFNRTTTTSASQAVRFENGNSAVGNISYDDDSTTYNTSSDYRLKENDVVISDGITRLKQLRPIKFNWKNKPNKTVDGFFAHEVSSSVPEAVTGSKDQVVTQEDIDRGKTSVHEKLGDPMYQSIDHAKLVPLLTAALQEEISKREEEITRQESEINALKERLARAGLW